MNKRVVKVESDNSIHSMCYCTNIQYHSTFQIELKQNAIYKRILITRLIDLYGALLNSNLPVD